jgi:methylamine--corrinoid protein Co-methyltransferase
LIPFIDVLDRAHTGPVCDPKDWDMKIINRKTKEKLKEYGLEGTCDPENPINTDDGLADSFWQAGFELAADTGMLCLDTKRIIRFTEEELKEAVKESPREVILGIGKDSCILKTRKPEDKAPPLFRSGFGPVSEDVYIPYVEGLAHCRVIDFVQPPNLTTIFGRELKTGTPYEIIAGHREAVMAGEAIRRAGRSGSPFVGVVSSSPSEYGHLGGYGTPGGYEPQKDVGIVLPITDLKTSYGLLHKVAQIVLNCGGIVFGCHWSMIGGYTGPPEGAAIMAVASYVLQIPVHQCALPSGVILDLRYTGNCGREAVWASSVSHQAQSRNTDSLVSGITSQVSGPCTHEILYEMAVGSLDDAASGCAWQAGNRSAGGRYLNHTTPLEQKFAAEVLKSSAGMKRVDANEIVKVLIPKYEEMLKNPPKGRSFTECYDIKTLTPTREWQEIYDRVWKELEDLDLPRLY